MPDSCDPCVPSQRIFPPEDDCDDCGDESALFELIAAEQNVLAGTTITFYSVRTAANRHPLYGEPSYDGKDWKFQGPFDMAGSLEYQEMSNVQPNSTELGLRILSDAIIWVARTEWESKGAPDPKVGDVVAFWGKPPFGVPEHQTQWDVTKADPDGHIFNDERFVQWRLEVKKREKFLPFRKTEKSKI